jgi:hypothetical protein
MASIQHQEAKKLLRIISAKNWNNKSYWDAAKAMGRVPPQDHSRAIAQMCDLLDAAACLAGVPLFALVAVRERTGEINPKAWKKEFGPRRDAIIKRSLEHHFSFADFDAISYALDDLGERGNIKAWKYIAGLYPGDLLFRRVTGDYTDAKSNAIEDLGTDTPARTKSEIWSYPRDPKVRDAVLQRAKGKCEYCGVLGFLKPDGTRYLESHHIIALAKEGADRLTNVVALCPNDHREAHYGERCGEIEAEMIQKLKDMALIAAMESQEQ